MTPLSLDISLIRDGKGKDIVSYLHELRRNRTDVEICRSLLEAVNSEYLPPQVFSIFLPWTKDPDAIALCMHFDISNFVQNKAFAVFGKLLSDARTWESTWKAVGGVDGLVSLFARISVTGVKTLARALGRCNRGRTRVEAREDVIEELIYALIPQHCPGSSIQNPDKRPVEESFAQMVPACSPKFIQQLLDNEDQSNPLYHRLSLRKLINTHQELLVRRAFDSVIGNSREKNHLGPCLTVFASGTCESYLEPRSKSKITQSMAFSSDILRYRSNNIYDKRWPTEVSEADIFASLFRRSLKKKLPEAQLQDVFMLGLQLLEAKPALKSEYHVMEFWHRLTKRWKRAPNAWEDLLSSALLLGLGGSQGTIGRDFLATSRNIKAEPELRWPLLRLYCLHVPKQGFDIDATNDFNQLSKQPWSTDLFFYIEKEKAVKLLKSLLAANRKYNFLQGPNAFSILDRKEVKSQLNFNVSLLLTMLQNDSEEIQQKAEAVVDDLRKKAATSREQTDRPYFATAAAAYAIASGSLDLYGDTVLWQQRFVRDPLTLKSVFARPAVMTKEGIDLLSGISQPLPEGMTLGEVGIRVKKANTILKTFHESMSLAKREPSFHTGDWAAVASLFGAAIRQRIVHAKELHKHPEVDVYSAIWADTLAMLEEVGVEFLREVQGPISNLLGELPPTSLSTTVKALLESGINRRKRRDRQPADDILESLSYDVLIRLVKSDKPQLARRLVLQTILERPDASSWHRQFLNVTLMKRLSANDAHEMLLAFATAIGEKLEEQSYVKVGDAQAPPSAPPQSLVKVTTVKYLAQLLDNAQFISPEAAVEVLVELFKAGTHIDIRLATLDSLLSLLNKLCSGPSDSWKSNPLIEKIMAALETVIPIVGSINERRPVREEEWKEAKEAGTVPDVSVFVRRGLPPLLEVVLYAADGQTYPELEKLRAQFVNRILLPVLKQSQEEHSRWVSLFLAKHHASLALDDLPSVPISPEVLYTFIAWYSDLIPQAVLEDFNDYFLMEIAPPAGLTNLNHYLEKNTDVSNLPEVDHWLRVFGHQVSFRGLRTGSFLNMIYCDKPKSTVPNGITFDRVLEMTLSHASVYLDNYDKSTDAWDTFLQRLHHPLKVKFPSASEQELRSMVAEWQGSGRLVLEGAIALLLEKKEKNARERKRSILPSLTKLRLRLLPFPCYPERQDLDDECRNFAEKLVKLLYDSLQGETSVLRWPELAQDANDVSELLSTNEERLHIALYVGRLETSSSSQIISALNLIRLSLAMKLIEAGREGLKNIGKGQHAEERRHLALGVRDRVQGWQNGMDEAVREKAAQWKRSQNTLWSDLTAYERGTVVPTR